MVCPLIRNCSCSHLQYSPLHYFVHCSLLQYHSFCSDEKSWPWVQLSTDERGSFVWLLLYQRHVKENSNTQIDTLFVPCSIYFRVLCLRCLCIKPHIAVPMCLSVYVFRHLPFPLQLLLFFLRPKG